MSALKAIELRLGAVCALLLAPFAAHAALYLHGPSDWKRGDLIAFEVRADADTALNSYSFDTEYSAFANLLESKNAPADTLPSAIAPPVSICNSYDFGTVYGDACVFSSPFPPMVSKHALVTRWEFLVKEDAPTGPVSFFDLGVYAATDSDLSDDPVAWFQEGKQFQVVAIPETSSCILMLAGLAAVGARAYRRRMAALALLKPSHRLSA